MCKIYKPFSRLKFSGMPKNLQHYVASYPRYILESEILCNVYPLIWNLGTCKSKFGNTSTLKMSLPIFSNKEIRKKITEF